jgi:hypothetical protein
MATTTLVSKLLLITICLFEFDVFQMVAMHETAIELQAVIDIRSKYVDLCVQCRPEVGRMDQKLN